MPDHYFAMGALVRAEATRHTDTHPPQAQAQTSRPAPQVSSAPAPAASHPAPSPANSPAAARPKSLRSALAGALRTLRTVFG
ncbi:hypothetical protein ACIA8O_36630 [Kitasatospora sp. NPDC051853]|uniref:hypothetical protein n=1 Tax=Kitasatospora sp. NPDC051853 TaxID=3364058 RepID=UPI0037A33B5F